MSGTDIRNNRSFHSFGAFIDLPRTPHSERLYLGPVERYFAQALWRYNGEPEEETVCDPPIVIF